jgi:3-deoxy-D-manno-octulosonic-acid transferase
MWFIYDMIIHIYGDAISVAALFNPKARKWVAGRKGIFERIESTVTGQRSTVAGDRRPETGDRQLAWFHCASLGELEQGRPVIEAFRKAHPDWKILLTFFSPSGYEIRKNYEGADYIFYLPLDSPWNAKKFIRLVRPSLVVFVKYEFWFRYFDNLYKEKIPVYVISAIFRPDQHFFKWYGGWALEQLKKVTRFFLQDEESAKLLRAKGIGKVTVSGDTRFDRVAEVAEHAKSYPLVEKFAGNEPVFLAGSTWPADEELIMKLIISLGGRMKFIIAPHEVGKTRIEGLIAKVPGRRLPVAGQRSAVSGQRSAVSGHLPTFDVLLFSQLNEENARSARVLIIAGMGFLSHLYQYATIAYIGGGFGAGIHNILEAAAFGKPVIFGPKYEKFREAVDLIDAGGAFFIDNSEQLNNRTIELLENEDLRKKSSNICYAYVQKKKGATSIILSELNTVRSFGR